MTRWLLALSLALMALPAAAHTRSESFSTWTIEGDVLAGVFEVDARRATQLIVDERDHDLSRLLAGHLARTVTVAQSGAPCRASPPRPVAAAAGQLRVELRFACPRTIAATPVTLTVKAFRAVSATHVHYAVVTGAAGERREILLSRGRTEARIGGPAATGPGDFIAYVMLGLTHVLSGADHLAFLLALALLAGRPLRAALAATGFTLGHSVTLGLTAAGRLHPDPGAVEALIGFTVAYAAWEALSARTGGSARGAIVAALIVAALPWLAAVLGHAAPPWPIYLGLALFAAAMSQLRPGAWMPVLLAAAFGLAHGAGFAGALIELDLARDRLLPALLGFNIGVECAQLLALSAMWLGSLAFARLSPRFRDRAFSGTTAVLALVGTYWFVGRTLL